MIVSMVQRLFPWYRDTVIRFGTRERRGEEGGLSCHGHCELDCLWYCEGSVLGL